MGPHRQHTSFLGVDGSNPFGLMVAVPLMRTQVRRRVAGQPGLPTARWGARPEPANLVEFQVLPPICPVGEGPPEEPAKCGFFVPSDAHVIVPSGAIGGLFLAA
jgi:hypothetical protein